MDQITALRQSALLRSLEDRQLRQLASIATERTFGDGDVLIHSGTAGALAMFVILEGQVEVRREEAVLATLGPGDHVGEMAVLAPEEMPRSADVVAVAPTRVLQVTRWDLFPFLRSNPDVALTLITELAKRLSEANLKLAGHIHG